MPSFLKKFCDFTQVWSNIHLSSCFRPSFSVWPMVLFVSLATSLNMWNMQKFNQKSSIKRLVFYNFSYPYKMPSFLEKYCGSTQVWPDKLFDNETQINLPNCFRHIFCVWPMFIFILLATPLNIWAMRKFNQKAYTLRVMENKLLKVLKACGLACMTATTIVELVLNLYSEFCLW